MLDSTYSQSCSIPDNARICSLNLCEITLPIEIAPLRHRNHLMHTKALLDSGANTIYIDRSYAQKIRLPLTPLPNPLPVYNVDRTRNAAGDMTHCAEIIIQFPGHREKVIAEVTDLGRNQMILGYMWLRHHNPEIDWTSGKVRMTRCPWTCQTLKGKSPHSLNGLGVQVADRSNSPSSLNYSCQVGSPIELELGRGSKPVLDSAYSQSCSIPDNARIRSLNTREITLPIEIAPLRHHDHLMCIKALLDSGANTIYID